MEYEKWDKMREERSDARQAENDRLEALLAAREAAKADKPTDQIANLQAEVERLREALLKIRVSSDAVKGLATMDPALVNHATLAQFHSLASLIGKITTEALKVEAQS